MGFCFWMLCEIMDIVLERERQGGRLCVGRERMFGLPELGETVCESEAVIF